MKINQKCMLQVIIENTIHSPREYKNLKNGQENRNKNKKKQIVFIYTLFR